MKIEKKRLSLYVPAIIYDRLNTESEVYGISKTTIVLNALLAYYRDIDTVRQNKALNDSTHQLYPRKAPETSYGAD